MLLCVVLLSANLSGVGVIPVLSNTVAAILGVGKAVLGRLFPTRLDTRYRYRSLLKLRAINVIVKVTGTINISKEKKIGRNGFAQKNRVAARYGVRGSLELQQRRPTICG